MEFIFEVILQFFFEFLLQIVGEIASELGMRSLKEVFQKKEIQNPLLAIAGYFLFGAMVGGSAYWW